MSRGLTSGYLELAWIRVEYYTRHISAMFTYSLLTCIETTTTSLPQNPEFSPTEKQLLSLLNEAVNDTGPPEASIISLVFMIVGLVDPSYQATNRSKNHLQSYTPTQQPSRALKSQSLALKWAILIHKPEVAECLHVPRQLNIFI